MNVTQVVPFLWVRDLEASLRFYLDGLGFEQKLQWVVDGKIRWCWLDLGGASLMLQEFHPDHLPSERTGQGVSLCFICKDALQIYRELLTRDLQPKRPFVGNGMWVTEIPDPDGYHLVFESLTDAPEESVYSD